MKPTPPSRNKTRAPRINLRGTVPAAIQLENGCQFTARLHQVSTSGGLLESSNYIDERSKISLTFPLGSGDVHGKAVVLFPVRGGVGYMLPFRFIDFGAGVRQTLETEIEWFQRQGLTRVGRKAGPSLRGPRFPLDAL